MYAFWILSSILKWYWWVFSNPLGRYTWRVLPMNLSEAVNWYMTCLWCMIEIRRGLFNIRLFISFRGVNFMADSLILLVQFRYYVRSRYQGQGQVIASHRYCGDVIIPSFDSCFRHSSINLFITVTSQWARWRLKSPPSRLFTQPFIQAQIKENIKARRHWPLCGEFTGDRWIPRTKGQ